MMAHNTVSSNTALRKTCVLKDGARKQRGLLNSKVVVGTVPIFIGAGHYPHPALLSAHGSPHEFRTMQYSVPWLTTQPATEMTWFMPRCSP